MASTASRQLAGSGVMPPHLGTVSPHSVAHWFSAHTRAALLVHEPGFFCWAEVVPQHFAFRATVDDIRERAVAWLSERNLQPYNFLRDDRSQPMVFAWMPALAIYFNDPDGHQLELIAMLPGEPKPELGVVSWEEWRSGG